jgi:hypothetical protein
MSPTLFSSQVSRAQVLKQASEYIHFMSKKNGAIQQDIEDIKRQNSALENQSKNTCHIYHASSQA